MVRPFLKILIILIIFFGCFNKNELNPKVEKGKISLENIHWDNSNVIKLNGEWEFYPNQLIHPKDFTEELKNPEFFKIPGLWTKNIWSISGDVGDGFATFRTKIILPAKSPSLGLYIKEQSTSYKLFIQNKELGSGVVSDKKVTQIPMTLPSIIFFEPVGAELDIVLQVSNFYHRKGGPRREIYIGKQEDILNYKLERDFEDLFLLGVLAFLIILHISIYLMRRKELSHLVFSGFGLVILLRVLTTGNIYLHKIIPILDYSNIVRIEYFSLYFGVPFCIHFLRLFFPKEFPEIFIRSFYYISFGFFLTTVFSVKFFSFFMPIYQFIMLVGIITGFVFTIIAIKNKRDYAKLFLYGFLPVVIFSINDILYANDVVKTGYFVQFGIVFLVILQSLILSHQASKTFIVAEELGRELEQKVKDRTFSLKKEISEKENLNILLQTNLEKLNNDLELARKIQEKILPEKNKKIPFFDFSYEYIPLEKVGGDLIDIEEVAFGKVRLMLADVIGHGIQASLITMLIIGEYEELKWKLDSPSDILLELNRRFMHKYKILDTYFPCFIMDIYLQKNEIVYSSAGFLNQFIIKNDGIRALKYNAPIIGFNPNFLPKNRKVSLEKDDLIICYSDGLGESKNIDYKLYLENGFLETLNTMNKNLSLKDTIDTILKDEKKFRGDTPQKDDITIIAMRKS
ncbi:MAG: SpoIIE family protein phosphatase [Leptospiraceae bacterium]|nr:SpoIIE family protein phosphatase [Leptospiraceae bacterium]